MQVSMHEARVALRGLLQSRGFTTSAVLTLGLGVAVTATMFSVFYNVLLQPLAYRDPGRLVMLSAHIRGAPVPFAFAEYYDLKAQTTSFSHLVADKPVSGNLTGADEPEFLQAQAVTGSFFPMLGVRATVGRAFTEADETPGITEIGVISHALWQRRFGGRPDVVGQQVRIDDDNYTIVGVMPPSFEHPAADPARPVDFWIPTGFRATPFPPLTRSWRAGVILGRLQPGVTMERAQDELTRVARSWQETHPNDYARQREFELRLRPLQDAVVGDVRGPLTLLLGAVGVVLLIACANVAGLQLARQTSRSSEVAVRLALGAGRWSIARPLLLESAWLGVGAAIVGVMLSFGGVSLVRALAPVSLPRAAGIALNVPVLVGALVLTLVAAVAFGLAPALAASRLDLIATLRAGGRGSGGGRRAARARSVLVVAEFALAVVLLSATGLLVRSLALLNDVKLGFRTSDLLTMELKTSYPNDPSRGKYVEPSARVPLYTEVLRRAREVPGVIEAGMVGTIPLTGDPGATPVTVEGGPATSAADAPRAEFVVVSERYFETMGIPLITGRDFTADDDAARPPVAIVSEAVARRLWPGADPLGNRVKLGPTVSEAPWFTVIGVVGDVRSRALEVESPGQLYTTYRAVPTSPIAMVIHARPGAAEELAETMRRTVRSVESDQPVYAVRTMEQIAAGRMAQRRFAMASLVAFSVLAVVLAAIGLYGLIAYAFAQRRREIGVRMALGATRERVAALVLRDGLRLAAVGAAVGLVGVFAVGRMIGSLLYGVTATDGLTLTVTLIGAFLVATVACFVPGWRAATVSPTEALHDA